MNKRRSPLLLAGAAALLLTGCGGGSTPSPDSASAAAQWRLNAGGWSHSQAYQGLAFYPSTITVDAGDTVTWTYPSAEPHTVTLLGAGQATDRKSVV